MGRKITDILGEKKTLVEQTGKEQKHLDKVNKEEMNAKSGIKKRYEAISKNGDTLELSEAGKALEQNRELGSADNAKMVISDSATRISDSTLAGYSESKLRQLYAQRSITKQQYDKAMKKKSET